MPQLHETPAGRKFISETMPELVKAVKRLADLIEEHNKIIYDTLCGELGSLNRNLELLNQNLAMKRR